MILQQNRYFCCIIKVQAYLLQVMRMIGETIREFEIQSELGSGGYGVVYRAHDTSVNRDVAIKVILPQYANKPEFIANFETEARLVAQLEHKDIVPLYAYWHDDKGAFLVMRYIRGGSLRSMIARQGALPLNKALRLIEQIADALHTAHEAGVVHRDLKPDNILIDERGNAYLTDFGIAKQLSGDDGASATDSIKGTFAYLSPEQIQQTQVSAQTDIYALGIMLYEMLAGQHPFHETPVGMMVMKHLQESLPDIRVMRDDLSGAIDDIIQKATAKEPTERYATTLDLVADLQQALSGVSAAPVKQSAPAKAKPTTSEERNRYAMLQNVRAFWVAGVLENSLHDAAMIDLGMKPESGAVDNPWDTLLRTPTGDERLTHEPIVNLFDRMNGKLLILGDPGSGKTTTLLTLANDLLFRAEMDDQHPIPVVFNLSSWSEKQPPLTDWLVEELNGKYQVPRKVAAQWLENDELLLLLDGLDEVAEKVRAACVEAINAYRAEHGFVDVVVCSRIKDYEALTNQLKLNGAIVIQPLNDDQIVQYLDALGSDVQVVGELITRDAQLRELAQSPLMLSIMVLAYRGKTASDVPDFDDVEAQRQHLFEVYVERMFDRRIGGEPFTHAETRHYLAWLAAKMQQQAKTVFNIEEIQPDWLTADERKRFNGLLRLVQIAVTMLVYFLMNAILALVLPVHALPFVAGNTLLGFFFGWLFTLERRFWRHPVPHIAIGIVGAVIWRLAALPTDDVTLLFVTVMGFSNTGPANLVVAYIFDQMKNRFDQINIKELVRVSVQEVKPLIALMSVITSIGPTLIMAHWLNPTGGWFNWLLGAILAGLGYTAVITVATSLVSSDIAQRVTPNQGIHSSLQTAFRMTGILGGSFTVAFFVGFPATTLRAGTGIAAGYGLGFGYGIWWAYGGFVVLQHAILRDVLARAGHLPRDLVKFLDYAASLILLRKVGGGYIFVHRYLLEYFAGLDIDKQEKLA